MATKVSYIRYPQNVSPPSSLKDGSRSSGAGYAKAALGQDSRQQSVALSKQVTAVKTSVWGGITAFFQGLFFKRSSAESPQKQTSWRRLHNEHATQCAADKTPSPIKYIEDLYVEFGKAEEIQRTGFKKKSNVKAAVQRAGSDIECPCGECA